jgi:hypothetical protein
MFNTRKVCDLSSAEILYWVFLTKKSKDQFHVITMILFYILQINQLNLNCIFFIIILQDLTSNSASVAPTPKAHTAAMLILINA